MRTQLYRFSPLVLAMYFAAPDSAHAHGWVEYPEARQSICYEQGGLWTDNPPNAACAAALAISGPYPFVQRNEVAINVAEPDYLDINKVKDAIPDGTLCYANDTQKRGLGVEHTDWTRVDVPSGTFELVFNATAPHNPSYWEIYLTKPGVDISKPLTWDNLELIQEHGNIEVDADKKYRMDVTIPDGRSGDAILFTRWQRNDAAGEGFYNCSDITIGSGSGGGDNPEPPPQEGPYLHQGDQFIPQGITIATPEVGQSVNYQVLNKYGEVHTSFSLEITDENKADWDRLLASNISGYYETNHGGNVFIGAWHEEMNHYMYFRDDLYANYFNSKNELASGVFSITDNEGEALTAVITPKTLQDLVVAEVEQGTTVVLNPQNSQGDFNDVEWRQTSGPQVETEIGSANELIISTSALSSDQEHSLSFELIIRSPDSSASSVYSFKVNPSDSGELPEVPEDPTAWNESAVYVEGDVVTHNDQIWTAHWWTQGEEPGTTGEWGVWR